MALREELRTQGEFLFRHRSYLPLLWLAVYALALRQSEWLEHRYGDAVDDLFDWSCFALSCLGLAVRVYVAGTVPANTSGRNTRKGQVAARLNTTGAYSMVRHPLYVGNLLVFLGICLAPGVPWLAVSGLAAYWIYYERIAFAEEEFLRERFGRPYERWAARTPAFLPDARMHVPSALPFCARTALKREYLTVLMVALVFAVVDYAEDLLAHGSGVSWEPETTAIAVLTTGTCLVVRWLRKRTRVLHVAGR